MILNDYFFKIETAYDIFINVDLFCSLTHFNLFASKNVDKNKAAPVFEKISL